MAQCIIKSSPEYQSLKQRAGISETLLDIYCSKHLEKYGRFPYLDEIPGANSESSIKETLKIRKDNGAKVQNILDETLAENIEEATIRLNNQYRDKEIEIIPIEDQALVSIKSRPTVSAKKIDIVHTPMEFTPLVMLNAITKLQELYGIKINEVNDIELASEKWVTLIPKDRIVNAFIYNGEIYINTDRASGDAKIHELLHILVGSMRFTNPNLYQQFIDMAEKLPNYQQLASEFKGKTKNDMNEEIFIQEFAKYVSGEDSDLSTLNEKDLYEINYNVRRILDSIMMGSISSKSLSDDILYNISFKELVNYTNSDIMSYTFSGTMNIENSSLHRKLNNMKSDLIRQGKLKQTCF